MIGANDFLDSAKALLNLDNETVIVNESVYKGYFDTTCKGKNKSRDFTDSMKSLETRRYIGRGGGFIWLIDDK